MQVKQEEAVKIKLEEGLEFTQAPSSPIQLDHSNNHKSLPLWLEEMLFDWRAEQSAIVCKKEVQ